LAPAFGSARRNGPGALAPGRWTPVGLEGKANPEAGHRPVPRSWTGHVAELPAEALGLVEERRRTPGGVAEELRASSESPVHVVRPVERDADQRNGLTTEQQQELEGLPNKGRGLRQDRGISITPLPSLRKRPA